MKYLKYIFGVFLAVFTLTLFVPSVKAQDFVLGDNVNMIIPDYDMSNDVWLDEKQVSDLYYRYDIMYDNVTYVFFQDIQQGFIDGDFGSNYMIYIDLNPMYNFIFAKWEDQGSGLYYWTEVGYLNPEEPTYIKTIIIDKDGVNFKGSNYNSSWHKYLWDDFENDKTSLIGYENNISFDYYDYNNGYDNGYWDGRNYGYVSGRDSGLEAGKIIGYDDGYDTAKNEFGYNHNGIIISGNDAYLNGYQEAIQEAGDTKTSIINFIPGVLGAIFMFFFQIGQIGILGITILDVLGILVLISGLIFVIKFFF